MGSEMLRCAQHDNPGNLLALPERGRKVPPCHAERSEASRPHRPWSSSLPVFTHVSPLRSDGLEQGQLLCAHPVLSLLLPRESSVPIGSLFTGDEACHMGRVWKACNQVMPVFDHAPL